MMKRRHNHPACSWYVVGAAVCTLMLSDGVWLGAQRRPYVPPKSGGSAPKPSVRFMNAFSHDSLRRQSAFEHVQRAIAQTGTLTLDIPEYHDEQRFFDGTTFGPMAYVFASPFLAGFSDISQINAHGRFGMFVAAIWVDDPPSGMALPAPYLNLNLKPGLNCAYLAHTGTSTNSGWGAFVVASADGKRCTRPTSATRRLAAAMDPQNGDMSPLAYPGVARFGEDKAGNPTIGMRCVNGWCEIGNTPATVGFSGIAITRPGHSAVPYLSNTQEGRIKGWHDEQRLAKLDPAGDLVPALQATVTPAPGLEAMTTDYFKDNWVRVATVWLATDPAGTKYGDPTPSMPHTWGMHKGLNAVELAFVGGSWLAQVTQVGASGQISSPTTSTQLLVQRVEHLDVVVPGTARFKWTMSDDAVWVRCDQGCCMLDAQQ